MHDKTKALLIAALLLPAMAVAGNENDASQNKQLQIEQIQEETALYEAMLAREKIRHELRTLEQGISRFPVLSRDISRKMRLAPPPVHRHFHPPSERNLWYSATAFSTRHTPRRN